MKTIICPRSYHLILLVALLCTGKPADARTWDITTVDGIFSSVGGYTSLALDSSGHPHISYQDDTNHNLKYASFNGTAWQIATVDTGGNVGRCTSLALDISGNPHISYYDDTNRNLKYAHYDSAAGWLVATVDDSGTGVGFPSSTIALDSSSQPHILYGDHSGHNHKYAHYTGAAWVIETVRSSGDSVTYNSFALSSGGNPCFSYYAYDNLYYGFYDGVWNTGSVDSSPEAGIENSLALDISGNPHISYYDGTNEDLKYAYYDGTWHIETVDSEGSVGLHSALALDISGNPHISYYDGTNEDLKYAYYDGTWHIETVDSEGMVGWHTSLALDSSGTVHISYYDVTNGNLRYARSVPPAETTSTTAAITTSTTTTSTPGIIADFVGSPVSGSAPHEVSFLNLSTGDIAGYMWNFGDGQTSTGQNPVHTYRQAGAYTVSLTAYGAGGAQATESKTDYIEVTPRCAVRTSLSDANQLEKLGFLRNSLLESVTGAVLASLYYQHTDELSAIMDDNPELREEFGALVAANLHLVDALISGEQQCISAAEAGRLTAFLSAVKMHGSIRLQLATDFVIHGMEEGYLLRGMGISVE